MRKPRRGQTARHRRRLGLSLATITAVIIFGASGVTGSAPAPSTVLYRGFSGFTVISAVSAVASPSGCVNSSVPFLPQFNATTGVGRFAASTNFTSACGGYSSGSTQGANSTLTSDQVGFQLNRSLNVTRILGTSPTGVVHVAENWTLSFVLWEGFRHFGKVCDAPWSTFNFYGCMGQSNVSLTLTTWVWDNTNHSVVRSGPNAFWQLFLDKLKCQTSGAYCSNQSRNYTWESRLHVALRLSPKVRSTDQYFLVISALAEFGGWFEGWHGVGSAGINIGYGGREARLTSLSIS